MVETGNGGGADAEANIIVRFQHKLEKIKSAADGAVAASAGFDSSGSGECFLLLLGGLFRMRRKVRGQFVGRCVRKRIDYGIAQFRVMKRPPGCSTAEARPVDFQGY